MVTRRALLLGLAVLPLAPAMAAPKRSSAAVTGKALKAINAFRKAHRKDPLIVDPVLELAAVEHAREMAYLGELTHKGFKRRMRKFGVVKPAAENIAVGQPDIASVLKAWENSSGHRTNMLASYNRVGMAIARNENSGSKPYWVLLLSD